jgi:hypothetical protein
MTSNFMIGPIKDGLRKDVKPYAISEDSFDTMTNAYQWRGRIVKRSGYTLLGRLQLTFNSSPTTILLDGSGNGNVISGFSLPPTSSIVPGTVILTDTDSPGLSYTDPGKNGILVGNPSGSGTINYSTGAVVIAVSLGHHISAAFNYYPDLPVMGLRTQEGFNIDVQTLIAFDTRTAYKYNGTSFILLPSVMPVTWNGTNYQFFFTTNYAGAFWATNSNPGLNGWAVQSFGSESGTGTSATVNVTSAGNTAAVGDSVYFLNLTGNAAANNLIFATVTAIDVGSNPSVITVQAVSYPPGINAFTNGTVDTGIMLDSMQTVAGQDGIRYYGALTNGTGWANYNPPIDPNNALAGALLIFPYRGYLVFLNTTEGNDLGTFNYGNRARWTQIGTPYYSLPVPTTPNPQSVDPLAARDDLFGRGGANDAPTNEVIVAASFIRDILVVYFERSTWRLRFVNNAQNPFVWERVNIELGSDCTFSSIPFDKGLMAIGNRGIVVSDGNDTKRFDEKIPDEIFNIRQNNFGLERVYGIRTFRTKLNYWTFPSADNPTGTFPDKVLVFNYDTQNWSFFDDCFTCFGYYYPSGVGYTWGDLPDAWSSYTDISWNSGVSQAGYENIVSGNQQGYVFVLEQTSGENDSSLFISAITAASPAVFTSPSNNIPDGSWITLSGISGITSDDGVSLNGRNFKLSNPTLDPNTFNLSEFKSIDGGAASGTSYSYRISYQNIIVGSTQINIGTLVFTDPASNGVLVEFSGLGSGTINYSTGLISLIFNPSISSTEVYIRVVTTDPLQGLSLVSTTGTYVGNGQLAKISGIDIQSKIFNFFNDDQRSRLSKIDFYVDLTDTGQFTCNVFADSSNDPVNTPLKDNPQSNVVLTSLNPYQIGDGDETIYRLYADCIAQTLQLQLTYSDAQMAVNSINQADIQILAMMFTLRRGGRLV